MRWFRPAAIVISTILVIILILGFIAPKEYTISLNRKIEAPRSIVFKKVSSFEEMMKWMPLTRLDPSVRIEYEGTEGTVGSSMTWKGNRDVGAGVRTIKAITPLILVEIYTRFSEPWEAISNSTYKLDQEGESTLLTWTYVGKNPFPFNILQMFMRFDAEMAIDFDQSLIILQESCENEYLFEKYKGYTIEPFRWSEKYYLGITDTLLLDSLESFYTFSFTRLDSILADSEIEKGGPRCGLFYLKDDETRLTVVSAAYPVAKGVQHDSLQNFEVKADTALRINHFGDPLNLRNAHLAMNTYLNDNKLENQIPIIEEYVTQPERAGDSLQRMVRVIYPLKPRMKNLDEPKK
jgi:effector-binding domain-containing protein